MKHFLVTGAAGFIGSRLCASLLNKGYQVTGIDNLVTGSLQNISSLENLHFIQADVNEESTWQALPHHYDGVFHYAALVGVRRTEEQPLTVLDDVQGLKYLADFARRGGTRQIVFSSSSEVYGNSTQIPLQEEQGQIAFSPYTTTKLYGEYLLKALWEKENIPTVSLRFFNVYGPSQIDNAYGFVVARFVRQIVEGKLPTVYGDGLQTRDFVYIDDNINAAVAAIGNPQVYGQIINVGTGVETSIRDLAQLVIESQDQLSNEQPQFLPARIFEIERRCASTQVMHQLLGYQCQISLDQGVVQLINWYQQETAPGFKEAQAQPSSLAIPA